jgi:hypothetical protein
MYLALMVLVISVLVQGCASAPPDNIFQPTAQKLIGKSQAELLQCAGKPLQQVPHGQGMVLRYYKEASMFEESRPFLKGSQPGLHHGCWASVLIENDHITGVEFRTVPKAAEKHADECEELFQACSP